MYSLYLLAAPHELAHRSSQMHLLVNMSLDSERDHQNPLYTQGEHVNCTHKAPRPEDQIFML